MDRDIAAAYKRPGPQPLIRQASLGIGPLSLRLAVC